MKALLVDTFGWSKYIDINRVLPVFKLPVLQSSMVSLTPSCIDNCNICKTQCTLDGYILFEFEEMLLDNVAKYKQV